MGFQILTRDDHFRMTDGPNASLPRRWRLRERSTAILGDGIR